jgi:hypothetical protein
VLDVRTFLYAVQPPGLQKKILNKTSIPPVDKIVFVTIMATNPPRLWPERIYTEIVKVVEDWGKIIDADE